MEPDGLDEEHTAVEEIYFPKPVTKCEKSSILFKIAT